MHLNYESVENVDLGHAMFPCCMLNLFSKSIASIMPKIATNNGRAQEDLGRVQLNIGRAFALPAP